MCLSVCQIEYAGGGWPKPIDKRMCVPTTCENSIFCRVWCCIFLIVLKINLRKFLRYFWQSFSFPFLFTFIPIGYKPFCARCCLLQLPQITHKQLLSLWLVAWHNARTLVFGRRTFPVLHSTCSRCVTTYVRKPSATSQPTRPTQPFIFSGSINE